MTKNEQLFIIQELTKIVDWIREQRPPESTLVIEGYGIDNRLKNLITQIEYAEIREHTK